MGAARSASVFCRCMLSLPIFPDRSGSPCRSGAIAGGVIHSGSSDNQRGHQRPLLKESRNLSPGTRCVHGARVWGVASVSCMVDAEGNGNTKIAWFSNDNLNGVYLIIIDLHAKSDDMKRIFINCDCGTIVICGGTRIRWLAFISHATPTVAVDAFHYYVCRQNSLCGRRADICKMKKSKSGCSGGYLQLCKYEANIISANCGWYLQVCWFLQGVKAYVAFNGFALDKSFTLFNKYGKYTNIC